MSSSSGSGTSVSPPGTSTNVVDTDVTLFFDALERLAREGGLGEGGQEDLDLRHAVDSAVKNVAIRRGIFWRHYLTPYRLFLNEAYSTGTVTYVHSTRVMTIATGTWPSWVQQGRIYVAGISGGSVLCDVRYYSGTGNDITLDLTLNPGEDISTGVSFSLRRYGFQLPADFKGMFEIHDEGHLNWRNYVSPQQILRWERTNDSATKFAWAIQNDPDRRNGHVLLLHGYSTEESTLDFFYYRHPQKLLYSGHEDAAKTGTVAISGRTVEGTSTSFNADMVGSWMRLTSSASVLPEGLHSINRYAEQHEIESVTDSNTLVLKTTPTGTYSGKRFRISTPLDLPRHLEAAFYLRCLVELGPMRNLEPNRRSYDQSMFKMAMLDAMADDSFQIVPEPGPYNDPWCLGVDPIDRYVPL